jgi:hypothetical protein
MHGAGSMTDSYELIRNMLGRLARTAGIASTLP